MNKTTTAQSDHVSSTEAIQHSEQSTYDDNQDIIWPTVVGIFVALALGWMICRYKCSSSERSPHIVRCCPKSLCKRIRLCCAWICSLLRNKPESEQGRISASELRIPMHVERLSNNSVLENPFSTNNSISDQSSVAPSSQQWPPTFLFNKSQVPPMPLSISIASNTNPSKPKRHPLRRESISHETDFDKGRRESSLWPFPTTDMVFRDQTKDIKQNDLFFNT